MQDAKTALRNPDHPGQKPAAETLQPPDELPKHSGPVRTGPVIARKSRDFTPNRGNSIVRLLVM
jgi:hypothetical protein